MEHVRTETVDAFIARLTTPAITGVKDVYFGRSWSFDPDDLPAINIYLPEDLNDLVRTGMLGKRLNNRKLGIRACIAFIKPPVLKSNVERDLNRVIGEVEARLLPNPYLRTQDGRRLTKDLVLGPVTTGESTLGSQTLIVAVMNFVAETHHIEGRPNDPLPPTA